MDRRSRRNALDDRDEATLLDVIDAMNHFQQAVYAMMTHRPTASLAVKKLGPMNVTRIRKAYEGLNKITDSAKFRDLKIK
jgi:hypothetical protein